MAIVNAVKEVLHKIRVKLYPNYLPGAEGAYIARTASEASLNIEEVCAALKNRGGYEGNYQHLVESVKLFYHEAAYQLCDGYAVSNGYYSIHPNIGGTFNTDKEAHNHQKHPIKFRFRTLSRLRKLAENITVDIDGIADTQGYIVEFTDVNSGDVNESLAPGGQFIVTGYKIKISGDDPAVGVYFVSECNGDSIKVTENLAENTASKIISIIPKNLNGSYRIVIKTQYSSGTTVTKEPRFIESGFTLSTL